MRVIGVCRDIRLIVLFCYLGFWVLWLGGRESDLAAGRRSAGSTVGIGLLLREIFCEFLGAGREDEDREEMSMMIFICAGPRALLDQS